MLSIGRVHHIMQYGVFAEFAPGIVGLAPNSVCIYHVCVRLASYLLL